MRYQGLHAIVATLILAVPALAAPPELRSIDPLGAQRGVETSVRIFGDHLVNPLELVLPFPAQVRGAANGKEVATFTIKPAKDTPPGIHPIRVRTEDGVSNLLLFAVDDWPQVAEVEPNGRLEQAQRIAWPVIVHGTLIGGPHVKHGSMDVDIYRFSVKAGERLTFVSETRRLGLTPDLVMKLRGPTGRELAYSDDAPGLGVDPRIDYTFREAGDYTIEAHFTHYNYHGRNFIYRLKIGAFDYARSVFPLGSRRGEKLHLSVLDRDGKSTTIDTQTPVGIDDDWRMPLASFPGSLPWRLAIGDLPEITEDSKRTTPQPVAWPVTINGIIAKAEEDDRYRLAVKPGQKISARVAAFYHGSVLDGYLRACDPKGKAIAENNDRSGRIDIDPALAFTVPADVHEVVLSLRDCFGRGATDYPYRLTIDHGPDFDLWLGTPFKATPESDAINLPVSQPVKLTVRALRRGFDGPIRVKTSAGLPGVTVSELTIPAGQTSGELMVTVSAQAPASLFELALVGEVTEDGKIIRRQVERPIHLAEPYFSNLPWNWRLTRLVCCRTK